MTRYIGPMNEIDATHLDKATSDLAGSIFHVRKFAEQYAHNATLGHVEYELLQLLKLLESMDR